MKKLLKIGIIRAIPWSYISEEETEWKGFCIDLLKTLAEKMNFEYELVESEDTNVIHYNKSIPEGIVGDLITGKIDMAIAAFTMTAAKAELVDYVTTYFENSGLSVVIRKPERKLSFFKFMTVLSFDVWLSIVNAIIITALTIWLIEKLSLLKTDTSQYYRKRRFTLKESFWFAVTSFASQGTGEIPVAVPHRILIASYWVFVLVMMTTFTANLAAFLTVERLQTPISSFWELPRQNRIKFTVVENSHAHSYFKNMKRAEETLFRIWKDIALIQTAENESNYRVWDYPVKEEYRHTLELIEQNYPVINATIGFQKVLENEKGEFALIHDTAEIRYYTYRDCRLIEIGEIFAERPYSIAVRKKSKLKNAINNRILDLHEERYFESLSAKYWNTSNLAACTTDDSESVTLDSLGGVFIAVICGMISALITLTAEVMYAECKPKKSQIDSSTRKVILDYLLEQNIVRMKKKKPLLRWKTILENSKIKF